MGAEAVARFTAAGHGDSLPIFLEVLEQEAEDRKQRRINRLRRKSRRKTRETFELGAAPSVNTKASSSGAASKALIRKTHALCARPPGGSGPLSEWTACQARKRQLRKLAHPGLPAPGRTGVRGPLHPHRRTLRAAVNLGITSNLGSGSASSATPWPPPRRLTGWLIGTSPATAPARPNNAASKRRSIGKTDDKSANIVDAGQTAP